MLGNEGRGVLGNDADDGLGVTDGRGVVRPVELAAVLGVGGKCTSTLDFFTAGCSPSSTSTTRRFLNAERGGAM